MAGSDSLVGERWLVKREPEAGCDWIRAGKLVIFCMRLLFGSGTEHARLDGGFIERRDLARETLNRTYNFLLYSLSNRLLAFHRPLPLFDFFFQLLYF